MPHFFPSPTRTAGAIRVVEFHDFKERENLGAASPLVAPVLPEPLGEFPSLCKEKGCGRRLPRAIRRPPEISGTGTRRSAAPPTRLLAICDGPPAGFKTAIRARICADQTRSYCRAPFARAPRIQATSLPDPQAPHLLHRDHRHDQDPLWSKMMERIGNDIHSVKSNLAILSASKDSTDRI